MLRDAAEDLLAFTGFPPGHWKKIWSTKPLERLPRVGQPARRPEISRRAGLAAGRARSARL